MHHENHEKIDNVQLFVHYQSRLGSSLGYGTKYKEISIDGGMKKKRAFKHPHRIIYGTDLHC
jgi:hypothetical protein